MAYSDSYVWFLGDTVLDTELTESLLSAITSLSWAECANYNASDLAEYGLDDPTARVTVDYTDAEGERGTFVLDIGGETGDYR